MNIVSTALSHAVSNKNLASDFIRCNKNSCHFLAQKTKSLSFKSTVRKKNSALKVGVLSVEKTVCNG